MFRQVVTSEAELQDLYRPPSSGAVRKQIDGLDDNCQAFIAHTPLVLIGTADADGRCDVSPKGGPPGFVQVLDAGRLAVPDLAGNNRIDSLRNLVANPGIALLFVIPGLDETLRVNGHGFVVQDPDVLDRCEVHGRRPSVAIGVVVEAAYVHCAKSFRRGDVWQPERWPDRAGMPTPACMLSDHIALPGLTADVMQARLDHGYATTLW
ncbi:MAG TPA: MSMEG_1061 family FMN-dependent PPOX-type flavoprotein [Acidimicrobiales bacterium]|nr:MSMEG_1061 family FMN-dependent PPOX-type flavoprotein [Acidimicrobiales bacterium]